MSSHRIAVVTAGLGQPSSTRLLADRLAAATRQALGGADVAVDVIELRDLAKDVTNNMLTGFPGDDLRRAVADLTEADALIAVTPIFNASYSGLFKSFFDVLEEDALTGKPVLVAATAGTARHSLALEHALRPMFAYLRAVVVPTAVFAASEDWAAGGGVHQSLDQRIDRAAGELAALVMGQSSGARRGPDPFEQPTPFEELLRGA